MANVHVLSLFSSIDILNRYLVFGKVVNNAGWDDILKSWSSF